MRITFDEVKVSERDVLKIVGWPDWAELAPLDYLSLLPADVVG